MGFWGGLLLASVPAGGSEILSGEQAYDEDFCEPSADNGGRTGPLAPPRPETCERGQRRVGHQTPESLGLQASPGRLAAQTQGGDDRGIARFIGLLQMVQKAAALRDQLQQAAARVVVLLVGLEVFREVGDPLGEDRDLHFRRTRVAFRAGMGSDDFGLAFNGNRHRHDSGSR